MAVPSIPPQNPPIQALKNTAGYNSNHIKEGIWGQIHCWRRAAMTGRATAMAKRKACGYLTGKGSGMEGLTQKKTVDSFFRIFLNSFGISNATEKCLAPSAAMDPRGSDTFIATCGLWLRGMPKAVMNGRTPGDQIRNSCFFYDRSCGILVRADNRAKGKQQLKRRGREGTALGLSKGIEAWRGPASTIILMIAGHTRAYSATANSRLNEVAP